ncbi:MAG: helix-turn-helix transcriptional regulator [Ruminococcus sp.]|nr:helix-turn-helix transcriptional regulator [Ruminococcus sp.]
MLRINLSTILGSKRISQAELARKTGIRLATINEMYYELCERVNLEHIENICEALNCDILDLFEYVPNKAKFTAKKLIVESHGNQKSIRY